MWRRVAWLLVVDRANLGDGRTRGLEDDSRPADPVGIDTVFRHPCLHRTAGRIAMTTCGPPSDLFRGRRTEMSAVPFGDSALDPGRARGAAEGPSPVLLSPKAYQLLELLVLNRPKALSKSALQD